MAQRVKQPVEASLGDPNAPILQLSDETYFLDPEGHWVVSTQSTQRMRSLKGVSFQLPCEECLRGQAPVRAPAAGRVAAAERGGGAAPRLEAPRHLRRGGVGVLRVAQRTDARAKLAGRPRGQLRPSAEGAPHRVILAFDGHCYMYKAVKRVLERQATRVLYRGEARQTLPPIGEWKRFDQPPKKRNAMPPKGFPLKPPKKKGRPNPRKKGTPKFPAETQRKRAVRNRSPRPGRLPQHSLPVRLQGPARVANHRQPRGGPSTRGPRVP